MEGANESTEPWHNPSLDPLNMAFIWKTIFGIVSLTYFKFTYWVFAKLVPKWQAFEFQFRGSFSRHKFFESSANSFLNSVNWSLPDFVSVVRAPCPELCRSIEPRKKQGFYIFRPGPWGVRGSQRCRKTSTALTGCHAIYISFEPELGLKRSQTGSPLKAIFKGIRIKTLIKPIKNILKPCENLVKTRLKPG